MAGINRVDMVGYMNKMSTAYAGQSLTNATKLKLITLGISTYGIRTEAEGLRELQMAQTQKSSSTEKTKKTNHKEEADEVLKLARDFAYKLNIGYSRYDTANDIIVKIKRRVDELISAAGDDENKKSTAEYWSKKLSELEKIQQSHINLNSTMEISANMNIAYFGIY